MAGCGGSSVGRGANSRGWSRSAAKTEPRVKHARIAGVPPRNGHSLAWGGSPSSSDSIGERGAAICGQNTRAYALGAPPSELGVDENVLGEFVFPGLGHTKTSHSKEPDEEEE